MSLSSVCVVSNALRLKGFRPKFTAANAPEEQEHIPPFDITVKEVRVSNGAGFIVALTGDIMTMPGLPKVPAANKMDILENGEIVGLF